MSFFAVSPFLTALGWALLNSLWQFAICWLIYRSFSAGIKKLSAPARHTLALLGREPPGGTVPPRPALEEPLRG